MPWSKFSKVTTHNHDNRYFYAINIKGLEIDYVKQV